MIIMDRRGGWGGEVERGIYITESYYLEVSCHVMYNVYLITI